MKAAKSALERPVVLVGMRCAGKTTVGRELARRMRRPFVDLDVETVRWARTCGRDAGGVRTVGELLAALGEPAFRELEAQALRRVLEPQARVVLAAGGGVVERADNRAWLRRVGTCVWLSVPTGVLAARLAADAAARPALHGDDPAAEVAGVLARRADWYRYVADRVVECETEPPEELVQRVIDELRANSLDP